MIYCDKCGRKNSGVLGSTKCSCGNVIGSQVIIPSPIQSQKPSRGMFRSTRIGTENNDEEAFVAGYSDGLVIIKAEIITEPTKRDILHF